MDPERPRSPVNVEALNALTPAQVKAWQTAHNNHDPVNNVCLRFPAFTRMMHGRDAEVVARRKGGGGWGGEGTPKQRARAGTFHGRGCGGNCGSRSLPGCLKCVPDAWLACAAANAQT